MRLTEARLLLRWNHGCGAYYLTGLAVECAIKACIAKQMQRHEFPNKAHAQKCYDHDLHKLIGVAGLDTMLGAKCKSDRIFDANWTALKDWTVDSRYDHSIDIAKARDLYTAAVSRKHGVLGWLHQNW